MKTNVRFCDLKYVVNEEKKTVVCVILVKPILAPYNRHYWYNEKWFQKKFNTDDRGMFMVKGVAKCSEDDVFDAALGKKIAEAKAKKQGFAIAAQVMNVVFNKVASEINQLAVWANNCSAASFHEQNHINYLLGREEEVE